MFSRQVKPPLLGLAGILPYTAKHDLLCPTKAYDALLPNRREKTFESNSSSAFRVLKQDLVNLICFSCVMNDPWSPIIPMEFCKHVNTHFSYALLEAASVLNNPVSRGAVYPSHFSHRCRGNTLANTQKLSVRPNV